jgi:hypothetical protein
MFRCNSWALLSCAFFAACSSTRDDEGGRERRGARYVGALPDCMMEVLESSVDESGYPGGGCICAHGGWA